MIFVLYEYDTHSNASEGETSCTYFLDMLLWSFHYNIMYSSYAAREITSTKMSVDKTSSLLIQSRGIIEGITTRLFFVLFEGCCVAAQSTNCFSAWNEGVSTGRHRSFRHNVTCTFTRIREVNALLARRVWKIWTCPTLHNGTRTHTRRLRWDANCFDLCRLDILFFRALLLRGDLWGVHS